METSLQSPTGTIAATATQREEAPAVDFAAIKARQRATWASGDYAVVGTTLQLVGESICEAVDLHAGERVLDVAAGNGNATLAAARRFAEVTGTDYVPALLAHARERADADRLPVQLREADAEALPFADASFDVALSTFGVMFTPDHRRAAAELVRVVRPGGRIGLASWTPSSFIGGVFKTMGKYLPPPAGLQSPALWGTEAHIEALFGERAASITTRRREYAFRYLSPAHMLQVFRTYYGPVHKAFANLPEDKQQALNSDLLALFGAHNRSGDSTLVAPSEYLEVVITTR